MKKLYVFPVRYPFTDNIECFLADEVPYLCREFDRVVFVPLKKEVDKPKYLPANSCYFGPVFSNRLLFFVRGLFNLRSSPILLCELFREGVWYNFKKLKVWLVGYITINSLLNSKIIRGIERELKRDDVCYFYWGKWSNVLAYYWKDRVKCVSRFHGWGDLWESDYNEYFPFRKRVVSSLEYAVHISSIGEEYFRGKYPNCKTVVGHLGSFDQGVTQASRKKIINLVSCSSLWPLKRVDLIMKSAAFMAQKYKVLVHWTHIGGAGEELKTLQDSSERNRNKYFDYTLMGSLKHEDVLSCYVGQSFDVFINLSTIEGVPVSIMEAISCGIPVVATEVGGTAEVVKSGKSGELVPANPSVEEVSEALYKVYDNRDSYDPRSFWNEQFNADLNYKEFAHFLSSL